MGSVGSAMVRRQLGRRLRRLREEAGRTVADVAASRIASPAKVWRIEGGHSPVGVGDTRALCWLYGADEETTEVLVAMALGTRRPGWTERSVSGVPPRSVLLPGLESLADRLLVYEPEVVFAPFQTVPYLRALVTASLSRHPAEVVDRLVELRRQRRRAVLDRLPPPRCSVVMTPGTLARQVGGPEVMAEQVTRLRELSRRDHLDLRVLPWAAGAHPAMLGGFSLLHFPDPNDPSVVYLERRGTADYRDDPDEVRYHQEVFDAVLVRTVPLEEHLAGTAWATVPR